MTLNERLFEANLLKEFDEAIRAKDTQKIISILVKVDLDLTQAQQTAKVILENPKKYGF